MPVSVIAPIGPAIEQTRRVLFRPVNLSKWFTLGFCAWLAQLGDQGAHSGLNFGGFPNRTNVAPGPAAPAPAPAPAPQPIPPAPGDALPGPPAPPPQPQLDPEFQQFLDWVQSHAGLIAGVVAAIVLVGLALGLLLAWIKARGQFMFLDGVVRNRGDIAEPWREYAREGNSLFRFQFALGLIAFLVFLAAIAGGLALAWPDIQAQRFGDRAITALAVGVPVILLGSMAVGLIGLFTSDFVVPIMYRRRQGVLASWGDFRREVLAGRVGTFVLYVLFQIVMGITLGGLGLLFLCGTCCLAALPYLGTVITLPLWVFRRAYPVYFLEQLGPGWEFFPSAAKPAPPPGYDEFAG